MQINTRGFLLSREHPPALLTWAEGLGGWSEAASSDLWVLSVGGGCGDGGLGDAALLRHRLQRGRACGGQEASRAEKERAAERTGAGRGRRAPGPRTTESSRLGSCGKSRPKSRPEWKGQRLDRPTWELAPVLWVGAGAPPAFRWSLLYFFPPNTMAFWDPEFPRWEMA